MGELRFCPKCHKVFYWELVSQVEKWCPNCYSWRDHNMRSPEFCLDDIVLQRLDLKSFLQEVKV